MKKGRFFPRPTSQSQLTSNLPITSQSESLNRTLQPGVVWKKKPSGVAGLVGHPFTHSHPFAPKSSILIGFSIIFTIHLGYHHFQKPPFKAPLLWRVHGWLAITAHLDLDGPQKFPRFTFDSEVAGATDGRLHCWDCSMGVLGGKTTSVFLKIIYEPLHPPPKKSHKRSPL